MSNSLKKVAVKIRTIRCDIIDAMSHILYVTYVCFIYEMYECIYVCERSHQRTPRDLEKSYFAAGKKKWRHVGCVHTVTSKQNF